MPTTTPTIFLTGFPGFLGSALAGRLLDRHAPDVTLTALVQPKYRAQAEARAREIEAAAQSRRGRIVLVEGDITRPRLGMDRAARAKLQERVREVYHLAAVYDLGVDRELAFRVNVEGTREVLAFAEAAPRLRRFQYVSTCYVSGRHAGRFRETDLALGQAFNNHYEETKYLAEVDVQRAMRNGLPTTIYRPAIVVGDSRTGATRKYDGPYYIIQWLLRWRRTAPVPVFGDPARFHVNVVPSDFVLDAMDALSALDASEGRVYQLADPHPLTVEAMLRVLGRATRRRPAKVRLPLRLARGTLRRLPRLAEWMAIEPEALAYFSHPTRYTTEQATHDLQGSGVACPPFESYADRLVAFMQAHPEYTAAAMV